MAELGLLDVSNSNREIRNDISAINAYTDSLKAQKKLERQQLNPLAESLQNTAKQLNKVSEQQKRFQRKVPTSMDNLVELIGLTSGKGGPSKNAIRKLMLQAALKAEGEVKTIIQEEALKALGCSQEQTYKANTPNAVLNFDQLPVNSSIFVPVQSLDAITLANGMLKQNIQTPIGKILYETYPVTTQQGVTRPFGGPVPFPFNRLLSDLQSNNGLSFGQQYNTFYKGKSGQNLFDIKYVTTNEYGVTGNYYKIALIDREGDPNITNKIGTFLSDYYSTIKLFDASELGPQIMNFISQFMNMKVPASQGPISNQTKFYQILSRILGLCFDSRKEIDVSGIAKVAELDGVDDKFFEPTEVDLRQIDTNITNVQNGVMEFVDCNNVKVPVDFNNLTNQFIEFKNTITGQTIEQQVDTLDNIINSLAESPDWKIYIPASFNAQASISDGIIKNLAIAVACAALSPKVLLPIFILLKVVEQQYNLSYNQAITSASTVNQLNTTRSNIVTDSVDFLKKFKSFAINVVTRIGIIFIRTLFNLLKKELINLISIIVKEIIGNQIKDYKERTQSLIMAGVEIATEVAKGIFDYAKCKSLLDEIKNIIRIIDKIPAKPPKTKRTKLPLALAVLSDFLPGESSDKAFLYTIEYLQKIGLPTDALPDGTPNLMLLYNYATHKGRRKNQVRDGVNDTYCYNGFCWSVPR